MIKDFVIKYLECSKIGYMKTSTAKYYLALDGILSIIPRGSSESRFCGVFIGGALTNIPDEYVKQVSRNLEKLTYMYQVLTGKVPNN